MHRAYDQAATPEPDGGGTGPASPPRPPAGTRTPGALAPGGRVLVLRDVVWDGPWRREFTGTVKAVGEPEPVRHPLARPGEPAYWVRLDAPQYDADGDGPFRMARIWDRYLLHLPDTPR